MKIYLNVKTSLGVETVDEFEREQSQSRGEFELYVRKMIQEYHVAGMPVYRSSRACKAWTNQ